MRQQSGKQTVNGGELLFFGGTGGPRESADSAARRQKNPEERSFCGVWSSGGGIRTPDTRIMIPLL